MQSLNLSSRNLKDDLRWDCIRGRMTRMGLRVYLCTLRPKYSSKDSGVCHSTPDIEGLHKNSLVDTEALT